MRHAIVLLFVLAVSGCAAQPRYQWTHAHGDESQYNRDFAQCEYESTAATQATDYSYRSGFGQELDRAMRKRSLGDLCMKAKGYTPRRI